MKKFIRENPTLAFGLGLPLLLVVALTLVSGIPSLFATPPKYDVVFVTDYYPGNANGLRIQIVNKKVEAVYKGDNYYYGIPKIYLYSPTKNSIREIAVILPPEFTAKNTDSGTNPNKITKIRVPELEALTLDNSDVAPDGYRFSQSDQYGNRGLLTELFIAGYSHSGGEAVLTKGTYSVRIPQRQHYYYGNVQFLGWVVPQ